MAGTARVVKREWSIHSQNDAAVEGFGRALYEEFNKIITDLETLRAASAGLVGSATWDPASIADGDEEAKEVTVTGAALGDFVVAVSFSLDVADLQLTADVTAADTVTCILSNSTGGAVDLSSGTVSVRVLTATQAATVNAAGDMTAATLSTIESGD